jgi:hypothetical protein
MYQTTNLRQTILNVAKKGAVTMILLLTLGAGHSFARSADHLTSLRADRPASISDEVSGDIRVSFQRNFRQAQILSTEVHKAFTKLTFRMDGLIMSAFYSEGGELLAVTHNIVSTQLPLGLLMSLKNDYSNYWVTELFEFNGDDQDCYYVSLESSDSKLTLRSNGDHWEVYTSVKK